MAGNAKFLQKTPAPGSRGARMRETAPRTRVDGTRLMSPPSTGAPSASGGAGDLQTLQRLVGNQAVMRMLDVQCAAADLREPSDEAIRAAAAEGVRTPSTSLPYLDRIQASFGRHSIGDIQAHVGPAASRASHAMSAQAYASGNHVVFGARPDLRTAAHEAAHIVQQRVGVQLAGGIGRVGDRYERHADAVADAVVAERSAEGLLTPFATRTEPLRAGAENTQKSTAAKHSAQGPIQRVIKVEGKPLDLTLLDIVANIIMFLYKPPSPRDVVKAILGSWSNSTTTHAFDTMESLYSAVVNASGLHSTEIPELFSKQYLSFQTTTDHLEDPSARRLPTLYFIMGNMSGRIRQQHTHGPLVGREENKADYYFGDKQDLNRFAIAASAARSGEFRPTHGRFKKAIEYGTDPSSGFSYACKVTYSAEGKVENVEILTMDSVTEGTCTSGTCKNYYFKNMGDCYVFYQVAEFSRSRVFTPDANVFKQKAVPSGGDFHCEVTYFDAEKKAVKKVHPSGGKFSGAIQSYTDEQIKEIYMRTIGRESSMGHASAPMNAARIYGTKEFKDIPDQDIAEETTKKLFGDQTT